MTFAENIDLEARFLQSLFSTYLRVTFLKLNKTGFGIRKWLVAPLQSEKAEALDPE
jgi:hypothetical protein